MTIYHSKETTLLDFTVVRCPDDEVLGIPLFRRGARFQWSETARLVYAGGIPDGSVMRHKGRCYLVQERALYPLDGDVMAERPALEAVGAYEERAKLVRVK